MKARMRTIYTVPNGAFGDCPRWAALIEKYNPGSVTATRVRWIGPIWPCHSCPPGTAHTD